MDAQQPPITRLQLIAPLGQDAMGVHWRAFDNARGQEVRAHELTGAYAQSHPVLPPGYELVADGGRAFVVSPTVPRPAGPSRGPKTGVVVGVVVACTLAVIVAVAGLAVVVRVLGDFDRQPLAPIVVAPSEQRTGPVNEALLDVTSDDCIDFDESATSNDPDDEFDARIVECYDDYSPHHVHSIHKGVPRDEVAEISKSEFLYCSNDSTQYSTLIWASADGELGIMICAY
jgi:hypothetical protein